MVQKKCDYCGFFEMKQCPFVKAYRQTTKSYGKKANEIYCKKVIYTKAVWLCPSCFMTEVKGEKLLE